MAVANTTIQMLHSIAGYGNTGDIITVTQTATTDAMITNGQAVVYAGPVGATQLPVNVGRYTQSTATAITLPANAGVDYVTFLTAAPAVPTLPTAVGNTGRYTLVNLSGGSITPVTTAAQTIDGSAPAALANNAKLNLLSDNTNWRSGV